MLCNVCEKNEAKVHLTQMVEGKIRKVDLCETCAKDKGIDDALRSARVFLFESGVRALRLYEHPR